MYYYNLIESGKCLKELRNEKGKACYQFVRNDGQATSRAQDTGRETH